MRRLALVLLDLAFEARARGGVGFGNYPLGLFDAIMRLRPLVPDDDPALPDLDKVLDEVLAMLKERYR